MSDGGRRVTLNNGYRFKHRGVLLLMSGVDRILSLFPWHHSQLPDSPGSILVMKPDHLGDLVMATAVLPLIAQRYPHASIDMLCGPWGTSVVTRNRWLRNVLQLDHIAYNRRKCSLFRKLLDFLQSIGHILNILKKERYDLCLNLRDAGGDLILLARWGGCRHIIGHGTGGMAALIDTVVPWTEGRHEVEHYLELLSPLGIDAGLKDLRYEIFSSPEDEVYVEQLLARLNLHDFVVMHPGSGDRRKLRRASSWVDLMHEIGATTRIVVTGTQDERDLYDEIAETVGRKLDCLMGELSVTQLCELFRRAKTVYSLDSLAAHLGAASGSRTVVLWPETNDPCQWRPLGSNVELRK